MGALNRYSGFDVRFADDPLSYLLPVRAHAQHPSPLTARAPSCGAPLAPNPFQPTNYNPFQTHTHTHLQAIDTSQRAWTRGKRLLSITTEPPKRD
jgi:hypothetical protein